MGFRYDIGTYDPQWGDASSPGPRPWDDDVSAFVYYASLGALDPKMPGEAWFLGGGSALWFGWNMRTVRATWALRPSPLGFARGAARSLLAATMLTGVALWIIDPAHRREGGLDDRWARGPSGQRYEYADWY